MRDELPAEYEVKVAKFKMILSLNIHQHEVPDTLILNMDETNTLFVPQIPRTRCKKGTREDEAEVAEDPSELLEEDGPEEEVADEPVVSAPKKKRQKRTVQVAASGSSSTSNFSRSGRRLVLPSTLHGGIQPNRYSTVV